MNGNNRLLVQGSEAGAIQEFMASIYGWMTIGLLITAFVAWYATSNENIAYAILTSPLLFLGIVVGQFAAVISLSWLLNRINAQAATALFILYSVLTGLFLSMVLVRYTTVSITSSLFVTAGTFAVTTIFGYTTKRDLSSMGSFLYMGLFGIILASIVNFFLSSPAIYWVVTYASVGIFIGLTIYDTHKLKAMGEELEARGCHPEEMRKFAIFGALELYLDFINLFISLLRIIGDRR